jgi:hypothetical protein
MIPTNALPSMLLICNSVATEKPTMNTLMNTSLHADEQEQSLANGPENNLIVSGIAKAGNEEPGVPQTALDRWVDDGGPPLPDEESDGRLAGTPFQVRLTALELVVVREKGEAASHPANKEAAAGTEGAAESRATSTVRTNKARTLDDVVSEIANQEARLQRERFPVSRLRIDGDRVIAGGKEFRLGMEGFRRLCKSFKAPAEYLASLKPDLRARVLQAHFEEGRFGDAKLNDKTSCIVSRDGALLDVGRIDLFTLDNGAVLQAAREGIGNPASTLEVQNFHLEDESFVIDLVSPQLAEEVRPGDLLHGGVHVKHSLFDGQATQVMAYVVRLICANGLVQRQCLGEKRRSTPRTRRLAAGRPAAKEMQMAQIRKLVADTWTGLQQKLGAIRRLRDKPVKIRTILERFLRQAHLFSHGLMESLLLAWEEEGSEFSAFGALNALTRVSTHAEEMPPWQRARLARLAGVFANQDVHLCQHCFSILAH